MNTPIFSWIDMIATLLFMEILIILAKRIARKTKLGLLAAFTILAVAVFFAWGGMVLLIRLAGESFSWSNIYSTVLIWGWLLMSVLLTVGVWYERRKQAVKLEALN